VVVLKFERLTYPLSNQTDFEMKKTRDLNRSIRRAGDQIIDRKFIDRIREHGGDAVVTEVVELYLNDQRSILGQIREAMAGNDAPRLSERAHALKGCSVNLGAVGIGSLCEQIELLSAAGELLEAAAIVDLLEIEASSVGQALQLEVAKQ
jgi:HPt (histidine-containing phosphotransfer) domain-containing protein